MHGKELGENFFRDEVVMMMLTRYNNVHKPGLIYSPFVWSFEFM